MLRSASYDLRDATYDYWRSRFPGPSATIELGLVLVQRLVLPMLGHIDINEIDDEFIGAIGVILSAQVRQRDACLATATLRAISDFETQPETAA